MEEEKEKPKEEQEDWEFDFSIYEQEEEDTVVVDTILDHKLSPVTNLRSRYPNYGENERLLELSKLISKFSIQVSSRTQKMAILWKYYGILDETWECIRTVYGSHVNEEIILLKRRCRRLMEHYQDKAIPPKVHNNLLYLRSTIYKLKQLGNFAFDVERVTRTGLLKSRSKIVE